MNNQSLVEFLKKNYACGESLKWLEGRDLAKTWAECERGDWLLWLAAKAGIDRKRLVMAACACARLALVHVRAGEERPRIAIETAESWCRGEATIEQVREAGRNAAPAAYAPAAYAAAAAADAAYAADALAYAAYAAADAAYDAAYAAYAPAAYAAADAAYDAAYAAYAPAAYAAAAEAAYAAKVTTQRKTADIVRAMITVEEIEAAIMVELASVEART